MLTQDQSLLKIAAIGIGLSFALNAFGAGKKAASPANACPAQPAAGSLLRPVTLLPVQSKDFPLPNGATVNLSTEIGAILRTSATQTGLFAPLVGGSHETPDPCVPRLQILANVTAIELDLAQYK